MQRARFTLAALAVTLLTGLDAPASVLYAATAHDAKSGSDASGRLYTVNVANAKSRLVGAIRGDANAPLPIDGLAIHPKTRVLYGITSRASPQPSLVTIDPRTARAHVIGPLGVGGTDIHFDDEGTLFIWIADGNRLGIVNLATGHVSSVAATTIKEGSSGGFAVNSRGVALVAAQTSRAVIERLDASTGDTLGALALDAGIVRALDSLAILGSGNLIAVNEPARGKPARELVSIDTETGDVTRVGPLPDEVDAIAFDELASVGGSKRGLLLLFAAVFIALHVAGLWRWRATS